MVTADLTDTTLVIDGTNKAGRIALFGAGRNDGPKTIARAEIAGVTLKRANALVNGNLIVRISAGAQYQLHFRKKSQEQFVALASALNA